MDVDLIVPSPDGQGTGIGRYVAELQPALAARGVSVRRIPLRYLPGATRRPVLRALPIGVEPSPAGATRIHHLAQIMGASVLLGRHRQRSVVTVHDLGAIFCAEDQALTPRIDRALFALALRGVRRADQVIAVSDFTRNGLLDVGFSPDRVTTVHHGIDLGRFQPGPEARDRLAADYDLDLPTETPIILFVGNEQPRKNLETLVDALAALKQDGVPFHWLKVGRSGRQADRERLQQCIADHGLTADVAFVDSVTDADLPRFYRAANLYVQPSVWEGFGFPVLEAMACGTPVVASTAASMPEICGEAAVLADPRSSASLQRAIAAVLGDPALRQRLRAAGSARASSFTWSAAAARTVAVYDRL